MMPDEQPAKNALRFNLRTALALVAFIAILFGWYASSKQSRDKSARLFQQLLNARSQVSLAESRAEFQAGTHRRRQACVFETSSRGCEFARRCDPSRR